MMQILGLDLAGNPAQWLTTEEAITAAASDGIAWQWGEESFVFYGGWNREGKRSSIEVHSIIALNGRLPRDSLRDELPLTNTLLFRRDHHTCAYCGMQFPPRELSRDHVIPRVQGGPNRWSNVVTACRRCNQRKGGRRPEETHGMQLLFVPYAPCRWEHFILSAREILADQMDFLTARLPRHSRVCAWPPVSGNH